MTVPGYPFRVTPFLLIDIVEVIGYNPANTCTIPVGNTAVIPCWIVPNGLACVPSPPTAPA